MTVRLAIAGAAGRMGRALLGAAGRSDGLFGSLTVTAASVRPDDPALGVGINQLISEVNAPETPPESGMAADLAETGVSRAAPRATAEVVTVADLAEAADDFDVLIDFTTPETAVKHSALCRRHRKAMVIGTTGLSTEQLAEIQAAAKDIPVLHAPNMSVGVNLCLKMLEQTAAVLGGDVDVKIHEAHHRHKKDAPSGTALKMGEVIANASGQDPASIDYTSTREGEITGEHTVTFTTPDESIEITHKAKTRMIFALGALHAAHWLSSQPPGLYSMQDVLKKK